MKFTTKQLCEFKKIHPEADDVDLIELAEKEFGFMSFDRVCARMKRALTKRQLLPWMDPKYDPSLYPKAEFEQDLTAEALLSDLYKYAEFAEGRIQEEYMDLKDCHYIVSANGALQFYRWPKTRATEFFQSSEFDFHLLVLNACKLLAGCALENAEDYRQELKIQPTPEAAVYKKELADEFLLLVRGRAYGKGIDASVLQYAPEEENSN